MSAAGMIASSIAVFGMAVTLYSTTYMVDEGHIGVYKSWGQAKSQEAPQGLQFKTPFVSDIEEFDVRERSIPVQIASATSNQLNVTALVSINWRPDPTKVLEIYKRYGTPDQFAANILAPKLQQSAKATMGQFSSVQLTQDRNEVASAVFNNAVVIMENYPAIITSAQLDDFALPERYWEAILKREEQREIVETERLLVEQQEVAAQAVVQTATAAAKAERARADAAAYSTEVEAIADAAANKVKGEAEAAVKLANYVARAEGLQLQMDALGDADAVVEFNRLIAWNGKLPTTVLGSSPDLLMQMPAPE